MESSSRYIVTIVTSTATYRQNVGEAAIKMTKEKTTRMQEILDQMGNAINVKKEARGLLIVGQKKENKITMTSTTSSWEPHYVGKFKNRTMNNIQNIGQETEVCHHILHIKIKTENMLKNTIERERERYGQICINSL